MKYIKTFEELNIDTYLSASKELRELGFEDRAFKIIKHTYLNIMKNIKDSDEIEINIINTSNNTHDKIKCEIVTDNHRLATEYENVYDYSFDFSIYPSTLEDLEKVYNIFSDAEINIPLIKDHISIFISKSDKKFDESAMYRHYKPRHIQYSFNDKDMKKIIDILQKSINKFNDEILDNIPIEKYNDYLDVFNIV